MKTLISCIMYVWLGLEKNCAELWPSRNWVWECCFRATYAPLQMTSDDVFQQDNAKPHTAAITTEWLRSRRVRVLNWAAFSPDLLPIENLCRIIKWKIRQRRPQNHKISLKPISGKNRTKTHNLDAQTSSNCFEKKRRCFTMVNMPRPNYFETCSGHSIWNELILCIQF